MSQRAIVMAVPALVLLLCAGAWGQPTLTLRGRQPCEGFQCLKDYVDKPDSSYTWNNTGAQLHGVGPLSLHRWTGHVLNFTSQTWLPGGVFENDRPVWFHTLVVIVPSNLKRDGNAASWGNLYITGGCNHDGPPSATSEDILVAAYLATETGTVSAVLFQVPNCPVVFRHDPKAKRRNEDAIIAWTWRGFIDQPERPEGLLRMPMTKAAVRAMDTMQAFAKTFPEPLQLTQFAVAGASKRGWTTWTTAAVDGRVKACIPIVMDLLNMVQNLHHHYRAYGGWTFAFTDYYELNFTQDLDHPNTLKMAKIIDPYWFTEHLKMPKLIINSGADEFFLPDDTGFWWSKLPEPKNFLIVPNAEHSEATGVLELLPAIATFVRGILAGDSRPVMNYTIEPSTGDITVVQVSPHQPKAVHLWHATTCDGRRRDFRVINGDDPETCGQCGIFTHGVCANLHILWSRRALAETSPGSRTWTAHMEAPSDGRWTAFFVHMEYEGPTPHSQEQEQPLEQRLHDWPISFDGRYQMTTGVSIVPNTFPFPDCQGVGCRGKLV